MVAHLGEAHNLNLVDGRDLCKVCRLIYGDRLEAVEHQMSHHILCYEDFGVACESPPDPKITIWLQDFLTKLKELRRTIMSKILFSEDTPPGQVNLDEEEADLDLDDILATIPPPE